MSSVPTWLLVVSSVFGTAAIFGTPLLIGLLIVQYTRAPSGRWRSALRALLGVVSAAPVLWASAAATLIVVARLGHGSWPRVVHTEQWTFGLPYWTHEPVHASYLPPVHEALPYLLQLALYSIYFFWPLWIVARPAASRPRTWATAYMVSWSGMIVWMAFDPGGALRWCHAN